MIKLKNWDKKTSLLHFGLAITVTLQLLFALLMQNGYPRIFILHEINGLLIVLIVLIHWSWSVFSHQYNLSHLFPWTKQGFSAIINDLNILVQRGKPPEGGPRLGLPGFIHGLGFLAVTGMAFTGFLIFISIQLKLGWHLPKTFHSMIADLVWIYWVGHVLMAITHALVENFSGTSG